MNKSDFKKKLTLILAVLLVVGLVVGLVIYFNNANQVEHPEESGLVYTDQSVFFYATGAAKAIVFDELRYPKNSEFEEENDFTVKYDKDTAQYTVIGRVYAANGFGVKQKILFTVVLTLGNLDKDNYSYSKISCKIS